MAELIEFQIDQIHLWITEIHVAQCQLFFKKKKTNKQEALNEKFL